MASDTDLYSDYVRREPHPRAAILIQRWHKKLLDRAIRELVQTPKTILEIGPGHGYFAEECRKAGLQYEFCDTSPAVVAKMKDLGFTGQLGLIQEVADNLNTYDLIWMSHVLEHSPTWIDARNLIESARKLLAPGGTIVVISPDALNWRREFFNVDWSHGYPTAIRNVAQLFSDVGLQGIKGFHHRNGSTSKAQRSVFALLALIPHGLIDRVLTPKRAKIGDGFVYSWKAVFGWRQIMIFGSRDQ